MAGSSTFVWGPSLRLDSNKSPFESPLPQTHKPFAGVKPVSWKRHNIGGLLVSTYGVAELPKRPNRIVCFWLLHGRGDTQDSMAYTAAALLKAWNSRRKHECETGLICACFDQRNHGSRMIENHYNVSWKQGNATHGQDMFNCYTGTVQDLSLLITQLPTYLPFTIDEHICGGVSLGGHATWVALMNEPRITAGMVVIGCPDYVSLMTDRAARSKLSVAVDGKHDIRGTKHFPPTLLQAIGIYDPAGALLHSHDKQSVIDPAKQSSESLQAEWRKNLSARLAGKKIICLSGGKDGLVPYKQSERFLTWLKTATDKQNGWAKDLNIDVEDILDPNARHEFSALMKQEAERWLVDLLSRPASRTSSSKL